MTCACTNRVICFDCWQAGKRVKGFGLIPRSGKDGPIQMPTSVEELPEPALSFEDYGNTFDWTMRPGDGIPAEAQEALASIEHSRVALSITYKDLGYRRDVDGNLIDPNGVGEMKQ